MPREWLDAPEDLPNESRSQVALGQLEDEVPGMPNQATTGLEEPLLEAPQGPALDGERQDQLAQEIAELVGDDPEEQPHLVGPEAVAREARPMSGFCALLDPLLRRPAAVVAVDDGPVRPGERGDDDAHARKEFAQVLLDLRDDPPRPVPGGGLILDAPVADQRGVAGPAAGPDEEVLDGPLQHGSGREADGIRYGPSLQRLVEGRDSKGRVGADDDGLPPGLGPLHDREEGLLPPVSTVDVARPERGGQAVAVLVEDEEGMLADGLDVAVVGRRLLPAVDRTLGAVDIQDQPPRERAGRLVLHPVRSEASESLVVPLLREAVRFDPVQRGCERDALAGGGD